MSHAGTIDGRLAGWPIWLSVGLHALGLVAVSSVVALGHHPPERTLVPGDGAELGAIRYDDWLERSRAAS